MQSSRSCWLRGIVKNIHNGSGFIVAEFSDKDVHFYLSRAQWNVQINDLLEFQLDDKQLGRPTAAAVRHIASDGTVLKDGSMESPLNKGPMKRRLSVTEPEASSSRSSSFDFVERDRFSASTKVKAPFNTFVVSKRRRLQPRGNIGTVVHVNLEKHFGFIRYYNDENETEKDKEMRIYFNLDAASSGLLAVAPNDEVSFNVREPKPGSGGRASACNVHLRRCRDREPDVIQQHVKSILELSRIYETSQDAIKSITVALTCIPVWKCIGRLCHCLNYTCMLMLIELLVNLNEMESLKQNYIAVLETLAKSRMFDPNSGVLSTYIEHLVFTRLLDEMEQIRELILIMVRLVPVRARQLTALLAPMVSQDDRSCEHFLYKMLKQVVKGSSSEIEDMEWDELPLVPTVEELLSENLESFGCLQRVRTNEPYPSAEIYLDTYFRLLRVDCFSSLTRGVTDLLKGKLDARDMHVYRGVQLAGVHLTHSGNGMSIGLCINPPPGIDLDSSSNLMFGNLLCISISGTFRDPIWATVINRELLKSHKIILVELCSESNRMPDSQIALALYFAGPSTVIVESPTYYRAYQPVLKSLQLMSSEDLVFHDELIQCRGGKHLTYITPDTEFSGSLLYSNFPYKLNVECYCMDESSLGETTLDASQVCAVKECLRNRVAIVQGPPGTGKTFVGVKVVQIILSLTTQLQSPILILTYKNHSLDEFLKELVKLYPNGVARVGGRSQEPDIASRSLNELRRAKEFRISDAIYGQIKEFKSELSNTKDSLDSAFESLNQQRYFTVEILLECLTNEQLIEFLINCDWRKARMKPFGSEDTGSQEAEWKTVRNNCITKDDVEVLILQCKQQKIHEIIETSEKSVKSLGGKMFKLLDKALRLWLPTEVAFQSFERDLAKHNFTVGEYTVQVTGTRETTDDSFSTERDTDETLEERLAATTSKQSNAKELLNSMNMFLDVQDGKGHLLKIAKELSTKCPLNVLLSVLNIWELSEIDRIQMVQCILHRKFEEAGKEFEEVLTEHQRVYKSKEELEDQHKASILQQMKVVGMTVTGANINRGLIAQIRPAVVLVEEAAEVLEPQLLAALGNWTEHLIMIGDHKQLRPSVENYKLAKDYHFDVSMMERLINNRMSYATLTMQNRMRPEFAELLLDIYPTLQSNLARVGSNKPANCIGRAMYFWDHEDQEKSERSFINPSEADRAICLALFLVEQGCRPKQITILSPYLGQVRLLRQKVREVEKKYPELFDDPEEIEGMNHGKDKAETASPDKDKSIQVHTVDLYQGDENDIVIVSLVRSNSRGNIGFLKQLNRRCVAQSRARCGLYFIGNCQTLSQHTHLKQLIDGMRMTNCVGTAIPLHCPDHPGQTQLSARIAGEIPLGKSFCRVTCGAVFSCLIHTCRKSCRPKHSHIICQSVVTFTHAACGHKDTKQCYEDACKVKCYTDVSFTFQSCGHHGVRKCCKSESMITCAAPCTKLLTCQHPCDKKCGEACDSRSCKICEQIRKEKERKRLEAEEKRREEIRNQAIKRLNEIRDQKPEDVVHREELHQHGDSAAEYFAVEDRVKRYVQPGHNWFPRITRIVKITNLQLEMKWLKAQSEMFDPTKHELKFHGTDEKAVESITKVGFVMPRARNQMFGPGIYFASDSSKSAQDMYTKGSNMLLLCDVLLGKSKTVNCACAYMTRHKLSSEGYDSLFAKRGTRDTGGVLYDEFVVFNENQAIPRYIIYYEKIDIDCSSFRNSLEKTALSQQNILRHHIKIPTRASDMNEQEIHFRIAESQFLRLMNNQGMTKSVESVDYYLNPPLMAKFTAMQDKLKAKHKDPEESKFVLAFHGTSSENIQNIVENNFDIKKLSSSSGDKGYYGAGIYFSEFPNVSMGYNKNTGQLLLCRVLPGKTYDCKTRIDGASLQQGYDSHRAAKDTEGRGQELVIFDADQILPCYVINFR